VPESDNGGDDHDNRITDRIADRIAHGHAQCCAH
jgi:hypothetical protein